MLSRAGLQIPTGNSALLQEGGPGVQAQVFYKSLVLPWLMYAVRGIGVMGPHRGTGGTTT